METIKDKIKTEEHADWIKCTLGLHKTSTALHTFVKEKLYKYTHAYNSQPQISQSNFTQDEINHINLPTACIRQRLLRRVTERRDRNTNKTTWEWKMKYQCLKCRSAFQKMLSLDTGESNRLNLENCKDTSSISLEWAIAKMFMSKGNINNKGPEDTDPAALLSLMLNCDLFTNNKNKSHKEKVRFFLLF